MRTGCGERANRSHPVHLRPNRVGFGLQRAPRAYRFGALPARSGTFHFGTFRFGAYRSGTPPPRGGTIPGQSGGRGLHPTDRLGPPCRRTPKNFLTRSGARVICVRCRELGPSLRGLSFPVRDNTRGPHPPALGLPRIPPPACSRRTCGGAPCFLKQRWSYAPVSCLPPDG